MGFFFLEKDIRGKSAEWLRDEIRNTKAFTKFSIDFVKNMPLEDRQTMQLPAIPDVDIGFCPACYKMDQERSVYDTSEQIKKNNFNQHCKRADHKKMKNSNISCNICGAQFVQNSDLAAHPCQIQFDDEEDFVEYTLLDPVSRMYQMLIKLPPLELMNCIFEEKIILQNHWPPLNIPKGGMRNRTKLDFSQFGNKRGTDFLQKALKQKIAYNQENSLILDKNVRIMDNNNQRIFDLTTKFTKPASPLFKVTETENNTLEISLVNPPISKKEALHSASVSQLMDTFYGGGEDDAGPSLYPNLEKLTEDQKNKHGIAKDYHPKNLKDVDLQYLVGMRCRYFWDLCHQLGPMLIQKRKLDIPQQVMLFRLKLRHNLPYHFLGIFFNISQHTAKFCFWDLCCKNYLRGQKDVAAWCNPNLTEDEKNRMYSEMAPSDYLRQKILSLIADPLDQGIVL